MNNEWPIVQLGDVCTIERGGSPRPIDKFITEDVDGINWIKIGDTDESMYITRTAQKIKPEGMRKSRYVKEGDFLLSNSMSFGRPYILKIDGCIHDGWLVLRDEKCAFDKRFLYYLLSAPSTYRRFQSMAVGGVVNNLNSEMVRSLTVPLPNAEEQKDIADTLDEVERIISISKQQLAKLDELVKSRFIELFGDGCPKVTVESVCSTIVDCPHSTPKYDGDILCYPAIRTSEIRNGQIDWNSMKYVDVEEYKLRTKRLVPKAGDIVYAREGTYGDCVILPEGYSFCLGQRTMLFRPNITKCIPAYLHQVLRSDDVKRQADESNAGSTVPHVNISDAKNFIIPLPKMELQQQYATFVEQIDVSRTVVIKSVEQLEMLKESLMHQYFG